MQNTILDRAFEAWSSGADLRRRRLRFKDYTYGRQWGDSVIDCNGRTTTEGDLAWSVGKKPLTNNLIRQLVKTCIGRFRSQLQAERHDPAEAEMRRRNRLDELDCRTFEEFLISGCAIHRVTAERRMAGDGTWVDPVSPARFFVSGYGDPRGGDIELIGQLHDMTLREALMRFAPYIGAEETARRLQGGRPGTAAIGAPDDAESFYAAPEGRCRVIEVWTIEGRDGVRCHDTATGRYAVASARAMAPLRDEQRRRIAEGLPALQLTPTMTARWHCRYLAPSGQVLAQFDSPYGHGLHPYAVKLYPFTDGEVHSFVEDVIDQQRHINRLITMIDQIMGCSAKGILLFPEEQLPTGWTWQELAQVWASSHTVLPYRASRSQSEPHQVVGNGPGQGTYELLRLELDLMRQISGVSAAFQGQAEGQANSAAYYKAMADNSTASMLDLFGSFNDFRALRDRLARLTAAR